MRVLPYEQRERYEEELQAELLAMAELQGTNWMQIHTPFSSAATYGTYAPLSGSLTSLHSFACIVA
ncbi:hypothetical protein [Nonomuraea jiangxiensis]|uniref:Uncharacterized protein n=1 Tax=Nonomuraea jiangxiensis TaxID=633440 RepID=A0A1G8JJN7_9ACTN|nr:hypothetical protein [Nonomuraea jiangxiensis]SDI30840.1 hypothetical protein SAMN05421869_10593 [Nonomuraea jiangxiensis]